MGFYGNIQNSNKVSLQFDLVYPNRFQMDIGVGTDGVFLGRYVAIDYGEMPIVGYYNSKDGNFYTVRDNQTADTRITPKPNAIYQDITSDTTTFYYWDANVGSGRYVQATEQTLSHLQLNSAYVTNYHKDVNKYGAAYDGTVWQKTYDAASNQYKYVLIAELNAKVPSFHLVVDKPTETPVTPYFDRDSTNMDYYLHLAPSYGHRIKKADDSSRSDEKVLHYEIDYNNVGTTDINWEEVERTVNGDIYYNKKGFDDAKHTYSNVTNTINYDYTKSGRLYGQQEGPVPVAGKEENDTYDWFFRIPALGNTICTVWDKLYGYNKSNIRYRNFAQKRNDIESNLVTYNRDTIYGVVNELRDALGYTFIDYQTVKNQLDSLESISDPNTKITITNTYLQADNKTKTATVEYLLLHCIFYNLTDTEMDYMYYGYEPTYKAITGAPTAGTQYFTKDGTIYKVANIANYKAKDRNNKDIAPEYTTYYTRTDRWTKHSIKADNPVEPIFGNSYPLFDIYGLISTLHRLIGFDEENNRDLKTIYGSINYIKDIIDSIDLNLSPGKMLHVNDKGVIETTNTYYPSSTTDADRVLVGNPNEGTKQGAWENRVRSLSVIKSNTSDAEWTTGTGTIDTNKNNNNNINFKAGNKWIGLNVDNSNNQLISILHNKSTLAKHDFATDVIIDDDIDGSKEKDCKFTIPLAQTDNAGHVTGYTTKTIYIPYNYRNITLEEQSNAENALTSNSGTQEADATNDTFTFATGNQWITANIDEDKLTFAHALIDDTSTKKWEFKTVAENGWQLAKKDGNKITIPTFEIDNAGHIVRHTTVDFYIPHNFHDIKIINAKGEDVDSVQTNGTLTADSTIDNWSFASQNKWLRIAADPKNDTITIGHSYSTQSEHDFNNTTDVVIAQALDGSVQTDNSIVLPFLKTDNAGHIIGYSTNTFYIPHNFKSIIVESNDSDIDSAQVNGTLTAGNIIDSWKIAPQNKWINIAADPNNNKITIGHSYSSQAAHDFTTDVEIDDALTTVQKDNSIIIPLLKTDNAGHVIDYETRQFYIPHTFKKIAVTTDNDTDVNSTQKNGEVEADNIVDTLTFAPQNQWIDIAADADNDKITIGHKYSALKAWSFTPSATDALKKTDNGESFTIPTFTTDNAGHIISSDDITFYVPHTFKTVRVEAQSNVVTQVIPSSTSANLVAENIVDTLTIATGNKWVQTTTDENNDKITFSHILSGVTKNTYGTNDASAVEPKFGDIFKVPGYDVDEAGHITSSTTHTVKIPQASYSDKEDGNVIVGFVLTDDTTSAFEGTHAYVGTLKLNGYIAKDNTDAIAADDTINDAFAKSEARLAKSYNDATSYTDTCISALEDSLASTQEDLNGEKTTREEEISKLSGRLDSEAESRNTAIAAAVQQVLDDLLANYNITLNAPTVLVSQAGTLLTASWTNNTTDTYSINWYKKQVDGDPILVADTAQIEVNEAGEYYCILTRIHNTHTASTESEVLTVTEDMLPVPGPAPEEPVTPGE